MTADGIVLRKAQNDQATFETILNQSFTGVYAVGMDTAFIYVNARFAQLCGYTPAEMIGRSFLDFVVEHDVDRRRAKFEGMAGGAVAATEVVGQFRRKDGSQLDLLSQSTIGTFDGRRAIVGLAFDITERLRTERALGEAEERARRQAERLTALWRIVNNPALQDAELWRAMLEQAAAAIRPGLPFVAGLGRVEDAEMIYEAVAATPEYLERRGAADFFEHKRVPLAGSAAEALLASGSGTLWWENLREAFPASAFDQTGTQSGIFTAFRAAQSTYVLWFVAVEHTGPWTEEDRVYVEVLASFFLKHIHERWQSDRLLYHQTHDVLTGVLNRSQFRSQARIAAMDDDTFAVICIDLNGFGEINETYGSMIGDALLVEVAAGLSARTEPGEFTGRLGGDVFAVYVPRPASHDYVLDRAAALMERFRAPFSTGDRDGKEFIALTAGVGVAIAPEHGPSVDGAISHAGMAAIAAKARTPATALLYEPGMEAPPATRSTSSL